MSAGGDDDAEVRLDDSP